MPPHPRMALVQALLVRALVARFWAEPYSGPLVRWGTRLHDRFLLPATAEADLLDVVADLNRFLERAGGPAGRASTPTGSARSSSSASRGSARARSPVSSSSCGRASSRGTCSARRSRLGGTTRYVDSSVERLQVGAVGVVPGRHVVTCNGVPVPLVPTSRAGALVGGRALPRVAPYSALHPTIGVHAPLRLRPRRHLAGPLARRVHLPRRPPRGPQLRDPAGQRHGGRGPPLGAVPRHGDDRGPRPRPAGPAVVGLPGGGRRDTRPAPPLTGPASRGPRLGCTA